MDMTLATTRTEASFQTPEFRSALVELMTWRRDVRSFRTDAIPDTIIDVLLQAAALGPSVGLSQPWRFARVRSAGHRAAVRSNFEACNADALAGYDGDDAALYARLKLAGLDEAPVHFAVFSDHGAAKGRGLGRRTMPETLDYSVVAAIHSMWLAARAHGVGLGWVSILDPDAIAAQLGQPKTWRFVAYVCLGFPRRLAQEPELQRLGWEQRTDIRRFVTDC